MSNIERGTFPAEQLEILRRTRTIGFFDIDDTLTQGNTTIAFARFLHVSRALNPGSWEAIESDYVRYKKSDKSHAAYLGFARDVLEHFAEGVAFMSEDSVLDHSRHFLGQALEGKIEGYKILPFAHELVHTIKRNGTTVAISGSPREVLIPLAEHLGFDFLEATTFTMYNGFFSGAVDINLALGENKKLVVARYLEVLKHISSSYAFGDTEHDIPMLEVVGNPYILGSNTHLQQIGREKGWKVFPNGEGVVTDVIDSLQVKD